MQFSQSLPATAFLCTESRNFLLASPWFLRRLTLKDGSIDMFEIDCLSKHIARLAEPTEEQRTKLKVITELRAVLNSLSTNGRAIPLMKDLLKIESSRANRSVPAPNRQVTKPNLPVPNLNRPMSDSRISTTKKTAGVTANPPGPLNRAALASGLTKAPAAASAVGTARMPAAIPSSTERRTTSAPPRTVPAAGNTPQAGKHPLVNHFLNKLGETANQSSDKTARRASAPALPLSAALASHQCSIR